MRSGRAKAVARRLDDDVRSPARIQMAARPDDGAALHDRGEAASDASHSSALPQPPSDQSLRVQATATASSGSGSVRGTGRTTSGALKLNGAQGAGDSSSVSAVAAEPKPILTGKASRDQDSTLSARSRVEEDRDLAALRVELTRVRCSLVEDNLEVDPASAEEEVAAIATVAVADTVTAAADGSNTGTATLASEYRVIDFLGGTYRGQVRARASSEQAEWQPHGLGVLTTATGLTCCGQWLNGAQVHHGTRYGSALHYEGDFGLGQAANAICHGVGLYTFGALVAGNWRCDAGKQPHRPVEDIVHPHGRGSLKSSTDARAVDGWLRGLRCVHQSPLETDTTCIFKLSNEVRSQDQPLRGLLVADVKLQFWRRQALTRAVRTWTRLCCDLSSSQAKRSRLLALQTQEQARQAEQRAIREDIERQKAAKSQGAAELLALLTDSRDAQEQRTQRRQLYAQRLAAAIKQRDLARACVAKQDSAVKALEVERQQVVELLEDARQAQKDCAEYARQLHVLKRQIENTSVKLNAARFAQQRGDTAIYTSHLQQEPPSSFSQHSVPPTPMKKTPRQREGSADNTLKPHSSEVSTPRNISLGQQFVCDVPGCMCGIPRNVFLRVAAALNDE